MREIETLEAFRRWIGEGKARPPAAVQGLDLLGETPSLLANAFPDCLFLSCRLDDVAVVHVVKTRGHVIPDLPDNRFQEHRASLYRPEELFAGFDVNDPDGYRGTFDYQVYREFVEAGRAAPASIGTTLARRLHDHSMTDALEEAIAGQRVVAVMGGHSMERRDPVYLRIARLSRWLTRDGFLMVSGGGPGAMEAAHLGAYFATRSEEELAAAVDAMKVRPEGAEPGREYADSDWLHRAWRILERYSLSGADRRRCRSIGIPTWLYGHEPPAVFATRIAKYFANSVREDGLLMIAKHGVIFAPGNAGTTQEIFQDAAQNHYGTSGHYSPMILLGVDYWTNARPVWPLLERMALPEPYGELLTLTDDLEVIRSCIGAYRPEDHVAGG